MGEGGVIQADRDAAAEWIAGSPYDVVKAEAEMIRIGQLDNHRLVQAFARHRQAAEKVCAERAVAFMHSRNMPYRIANDVATAIRSQNDG